MTLSVDWWGNNVVSQGYERTLRAKDSVSRHENISVNAWARFEIKLRRFLEIAGETLADDARARQG